MGIAPAESLEYRTSGQIFERVAGEPWQRQGQFTHRSGERPAGRNRPHPYTGAAQGLFYQYINPNVFAQNQTGAFGNAGHNSLRAPGYFDVDVAVTREFRFVERFTLQARGEAFNALNHPNFGGPNATLSSSTFGQIRSARDPRILQASMKLIF